MTAPVPPTTKTTWLPRTVFTPDVMNYCQVAQVTLATAVRVRTLMTTATLNESQRERRERLLDILRLHHVANPEQVADFVKHGGPKPMRHLAITVDVLRQTVAELERDREAQQGILSRALTRLVKFVGLAQRAKTYVLSDAHEIPIPAARLLAELAALAEPEATLPDAPDAEPPWSLT